MNDQTAPLATAIPPEVRLFLAVVRRELADLDPEELTEITDGLEADLADLVAERGAEALGDPKAYAQELRSAAGITETVKARPSRRPVRESVAGFLDACHGWFDHQVDRLPGDVSPVLDWLRPAWWILRAWVAVQLVDIFVGGGSYNGGISLIPTLMGVGWLVLAVAVFVSVQIGRGRFWPGGDRGLGARLVLLGLNLFAVAMVPVALSNLDGGYGPEWDQGWQEGRRAGLVEASGVEPGYDGDAAGTWLSLKGKPVTNIYAYDSQGRRMAGVQLFDQDGRPLEVADHAVCPKGDDGSEIGKEQHEGGEWVCYDYTSGEVIPGMVLYPWTNGQAQLRNVFPLAGRTQDTLDPSPTAFQEAQKPTLGLWPFAEVPRVSLPGITSGVLDDEPGKPAPAATD